MNEETARLLRSFAGPEVPGGATPIRTEPAMVNETTSRTCAQSSLGATDDNPRKAPRSFWRSTFACSAVVRQLHATRSEEHTSELQSREKLVCCLLLDRNTQT